MKCASAIISFIFLALMLVSCDNKENLNQDEQILQNEQADASQNSQAASISENYYKPFTLYLSSGKKINMQKNQTGFDISSNQMILLNFFTSSCGAPCKVQSKYLNAFAKKYPDDLRVIGVILEDYDENTIIDLAKEENINYELSYGENNYLLAKAANEELNIAPTSILYDKNGNFIRSYEGITPPEMIESDIKRELE